MSRSLSRSPGDGTRGTSHTCTLCWTMDYEGVPRRGGMCPTCGPPKPPMLLYDVLRDSPLFDVDPHAHLPDLECLYIVVGLLSAAYHTHHTETLAALLPWVTGCLGPNVTCGAPIAAGSAAFASTPAFHRPQPVSSLHVMLLAPSGSGKSTLVNDLATKLAPVYGTNGVHSGSSPQALLCHLKATKGCSVSASDESWTLYGADYLGKSAKGHGAGASDGDLLNKCAPRCV